MNRELYDFWLCTLYKIGMGKKLSLLRAYASPELLFKEPEIPWKFFPDFTPEDIALFEKSRDREVLEKQFCDMVKSGMVFLSRSSPLYPPLLSEIDNAPFGLFALGKTELLSHPFPVAIVGARDCTCYGRQNAEAIAGYLAREGFVIVSGMARGIDAAAHQGVFAALPEEDPAPAIAVLGCGADICYPRENLAIYRRLRETGLILSEYPPQTPAYSLNFPLRNRIISGMCLATVVTEARRKSGSLLTAKLAADQGREVFAVPGRIQDAGSEGCNHLIYEGATPLLHPSYLIKELSLQGLTPHSGQKNKEKRKKGLEKSEILVYSLMDFDPLHIDELCRRSGLTAGELAGPLMSLLLKGFITQPLRNYYMKQIDY